MSHCQIRKNKQWTIPPFSFFMSHNIKINWNKGIEQIANLLKNFYKIVGILTQQNKWALQGIGCHFKKTDRKKKRMKSLGKYKCLYA